MVTTVPTGTLNWDVPLNAALTDLQGQITNKRLDQLVAPTASVGAGGQKIINLANGAAANDAAAFGQIPVAGTAAGTYAAGNDSRITNALPSNGGAMSGTYSGNPNFSGVPSFAQSLRVGTASTLGDNGVGEIQLADAATVPTTNPPADR